MSTRAKITGEEPTTGFSIPGYEPAGWNPETVHGLTIRQHYAGMAMQGLLANYKANGDEVNDGWPFVAQKAVMCADALIAELNK